MFVPLPLSFFDLFDLPVVDPLCCFFHTRMLDKIEDCSPPQAPHLDQVKMHCATTATLLLRNVSDFTRDVACLSEATADLSQRRCFDASGF